MPWSPSEKRGPICEGEWPIYDESKTIESTKEIGVQVNGKVRGKIVIGIDEDEESVKNDSLAKQVNGIIDIVCLLIYLVVSFKTGAWHITWIIFIINGLINRIVKLLFNLKNHNNSSEEEE